MSVKTFSRSFSGGEITPEMYGRVDLAKYQTGLATCRGFMVLPHGPVANRPGTEYVIETKDSTRASVLIPFVYSTTQAYVLELGHLYLRVHTEGATLLEASRVVNSITQASPGVFNITAHGFVAGQWIHIAGAAGMTEVNGRYWKVGVVLDPDTVSLTDLAGVALNTAGFGAYTGSGTASRVYEIVTPYAEADLFDLHYTQSADVLTLVHPTYQQAELRRLGATNWTLTSFTLAPVQVAPTNVVATPTGTGSETYNYVVTAIAADGLEESLASGSASCSNNLATAAQFNVITWDDAAGAVRYNVFREENGLFGFIGQAADGTTGFKDTNFDPDVSKTPAEAEDPFVGAGNYPQAVGYHEGRRWFGGTNNRPQNLWGTRSGTESNMSYSIPTKDDDRIAVRIAARQANTIRHIIPLDELMLLTSGGEWRITAQNSDVITPATISYKPQGNIGSSNVQPAITNRAVLYAQDRGGRVNELLYKWESQGYETRDVSILAPHLFDAYTIRQLAYSRAPYSILWAVRSDGVLLGLTYVVEHQVAGWHWHDTEGAFESVCSIPEGNEDTPYFIVQRNVNGRSVRYVERLHTRAFATLPDAFFLDCGATYSGAPATSIGGLHHLEGKAVSVLADGAVVRGLTVTGGRITLAQAASKVHVGLAITADFKLLPLALEAEAFGQGTAKNVNKVHLRVNQSSGIFVGPSVDRLREHKQRTTEPFGSPPALVTGEITVTVDPAWGRDGSVSVRQVDPLPLTVAAMVLEVDIGG